MCDCGVKCASVGGVWGGGHTRIKAEINLTGDTLWCYIPVDSDDINQETSHHQTVLGD